MPTLIFHNAVRDLGEIPTVTSNIQELERAERAAQRQQDEILSLEKLELEELECNGNLILRDWLDLGKD